ncbi:MAG: hypothetical protein DHS20C21_03410 [Gemmatimonadota bacterium]|nr:MAG: hypothetical protein DHS20C21_03410 [Gemmatimonadota bacterium]
METFSDVMGMGWGWIQTWYGGAATVLAALVGWIRFLDGQRSRQVTSLEKRRAKLVKQVDELQPYDDWVPTSGPGFNPIRVAPEGYEDAASALQEVDQDLDGLLRKGSLPWWKRML